MKVRRSPRIFYYSRLTGLRPLATREIGVGADSFAVRFRTCARPKKRQALMGVVEKMIPTFTVDGASIPRELRELKQWVCRKGKMPLQPCNPQVGADSTNPDHWTDYTAAALAAMDNALDGVSFAFAQNGLVGIDLDECRDPENGAIQPWASLIIESLDSYTEESISGRGVHVIARGTKPGDRCKTELQGGTKVEMYDRARFFVMTGKVIGERRTLEDRQEQIEQLYNEWFPPDPIRPVPDAVLNTQPLDLTDDEIIQLGQNEGGKFSALWAGDFGAYPSQSEADEALVCKLAFYTKDEARLDQLFRQSGLMRESKWNRASYRERTIKSALKLVTESYRRPRPKSERNGAQPAFDQSIAASEKAIKLPRVWTALSILSADLPRPEFIIKGILPRRGSCLIVARAKTFKTKLAVQVGLAATSGECEFLGWRFGRPGRVLIIRAEVEDEFFQTWFEDLLSALPPWARQENLENFFIPSLADFRPKLDDPARRAIVESLIEEHKPEAVIFDSLKFLNPTLDENDGESMGKALDVISEICRKFNCANVTIHHAGKNNTYRGHSVIEGWPDSMVELSLVDDDDEEDESADRIIKVGGIFRHIAPPKPIYWRAPADGRPWFEIAPDPPKKKGKSGAPVNPDLVSMIVRDAGKALAYGDLVDRVKSTASTGVNKAKAAITEATAKGIVTPTPMGRTTLYSV